MGLIRGDGPFSLRMLGTGDVLLSVVGNLLAQRVARARRDRRVGAPARPIQPRGRAARDGRADPKAIARQSDGIALACWLLRRAAPASGGCGRCLVAEEMWKQCA